MATLALRIRSGAQCENCHGIFKEGEEKVAGRQGMLHKTCSGTPFTVTPLRSSGIDAGSATSRATNVYLGYVAAAFLLLTGAYFMNAGLNTENEVSVVGKIANRVLGEEIMLSWELTKIFTGVLDLVVGVAMIAGGLVIPLSNSVKK
jgi:hypothetical protein